MHLEFDTELASGTLDEYVRKVRSSKVRMIVYTYVLPNVALFISAELDVNHCTYGLQGGFLNNTLDNDIIGGHFQNLDCKLREKSLEVSMSNTPLFINYFPCKYFNDNLMLNKFIFYSEEINFSKRKIDYAYMSNIWKISLEMNRY